MQDRRRNILILLVVIGLLAASLVVISTHKTRLGLDLKGGVQLVYQGRPASAPSMVSRSSGFSR